MRFRKVHPAEATALRASSAAHSSYPCRWAVLLATGMALATAAGAQSTPAAAGSAAGVTVSMPDPHKVYMDPETGSPIAGVNPALPIPAFPTSSRDVRTFTAEVVYRFAHYDYTPAVAVQSVSRAGADLKTPEGALIAVVSAMQQKDYEWFLASWDKKSATDIRDLDMQNGGPEATKNQWQEMFVGRHVEITERIESGLYVAILFRAYQPGVAKPALSTAMVFKLDGARWVATNEAEMTNAFVILHQGETAKVSQKGYLTPLVNGTGYLEDGEPNPEDVAQSEFLHQYPAGKTRVIRVMQ